ncbi:MAG: TetR/AcrR family transcriptional regulator [Pseudomonadota bacterium]
MNGVQAKNERCSKFGVLTLRHKTNTKRDALRTRLIEAAEEEIAALGLSGLKARRVTQKAGCALGALYNAVSDLDGLIILVNSKTIQRLGAQLDAAARDADTPAATLQALAATYVTFAISEHNLWFAAFNHRLPDGQDLPDWHQGEYLDLIKHLAQPLTDLLPTLDAEAIGLRAQTLFASVHGVVQLSLNGQFVGTPLETLPREVSNLVEAVTIGLNAHR